MQSLNSYREVPPGLRGAVLAIGNFDGVHRGHRAVIEKVKALATMHGTTETPAGVMFFEPHPIAFFQPDVPLFLLTTTEQKLALFEQAGLDLAVALPFDRALASLDADAFVADVLVGGLAISHVVIGYDFHFGKGRSGSPETMRALGNAHGFGVTVVEPEGDEYAAGGGEVFSSSRVRAALRAGHVEDAVHVLGRWWSISGVVESGARRGTSLGFPTANLTMPPGSDLMPGIYAVRVTLDGRTIDGAAYLGTRPTFDDGAVKLETFLFDFDGELYGKRIEVAFVGFIRGDQAFASAEELTARMAKDCEAARKILEQAACASPERHSGERRNPEV